MLAKTSSLITLLIASVLLAACRRAPVTADPADVAQLESPTAKSPVLNACDPEAQAAAMRPDQVPDWTTLNPSACYRLELDLQPEAGTFQGTARVALVNTTSSPWPNLVFRTYPNSTQIYGGSLEVTGARVDGEPASPQVFLPDRTAVRLSLPAPLAPGNGLAVELDFSGQVPIDFNDLTSAYGVFNFTTADQVLALANGYPLLAEWQAGDWQTKAVLGGGDAVVSEVALYQVQVTAPAGWQVASTGTVLNQESQGDRTRWAFVSGPAREFMLLASPNFVEQQAQAGDVRIRHWGLPGGKANWEAAIQATVDSLTVFSARFGPYPYAELDVVAAPLQYASGVEYPGLFILRDRLYRDSLAKTITLELVAAHEVAHQWWYAVVGSDVLEHPWQDEGLTTFSGLLYQEAYHPGSYDGTIQFHERQVALVEDQPGDNAIDQPVQAFQGRLAAYRSLVYDKGALFFNTLRQQLGDEAFFAALQAYYAGNRYLLAEPKDLLSAFEASCRCELDDFYDVWGVSP